MLPMTGEDQKQHRDIAQKTTMIFDIDFFQITELTRSNENLRDIGTKKCQNFIRLF